METITTIDFGEIRIVQRGEELIRKDLYQGVLDCQGNYYSIKLTMSNETVAVLDMDEDEVDEETDNLMDEYRDCIDYNDIYGADE